MDKTYRNVLTKIFTLDFARWVRHETVKQAQLKKLPLNLRTETLVALVLLGNN